MDCNRIVQKQVVQIVGFRSAALIPYSKLASELIPDDP